MAKCAYSDMASKTTADKVALVCGAGGFIGHHLVRRLKREGFWVRGADLKFARFSETEADDFMIGDLRDPYFVRQVIDRRFDEIYLRRRQGKASFARIRQWGYRQCLQGIRSALAGLAYRRAETSSMLRANDI
jgi:hypothetical protein